MLGQRAARASQLGPATCGEQGAVCTLLSGCCDGLTCATSAINTSYGICVPGDGGMVSTGTTLISPFSETAVDEVSALVETASTAPTTDPQAEQEARIAEIRARKDAKSSKRKTRLDTKRSNQKTRKDEQRERRLDAREAEEDALEEALGPALEFELLNPGGVPGTETLTIRNLDDDSVLLVKIESVLHPDNNNSTNRTVPPGGSFNYYSGISDDISDQDEQAWINQPICSGADGAGFRVTVANHGNSVNQQHVVPCDAPSLFRVNEPPVDESPPKRKKTNDRKRKRNNQHQKKKR
jgi:hypothetical protein